MGFWSWLIGNPPALDAPAFAVDADAIDPAVFGLTSYPATPARAGRVARATAMQVPAVKRAHDLIAGAIGQLPIDLLDPQRQRVEDFPLFSQPERDVPATVTKTRLAGDLFFEGIAWWQITEWAHLPGSSWPLHVKRLDPRTVDVHKDGTVWVDGREVPAAQLIRFDSPNDPILVAGARAIRTALALDATAQLYATEPMPLGYFEPRDGVDPATDDEIIAILNDWAQARQTRATAYVPAALAYKSVQFSPEQMQLADARQHAVLEIARAAGIDPEELGVSTTSRTYSNSFDRRKAFLDFTLGGYLRAIEDRLSMGDISPAGYVARMSTDAFLRSDALSRFQAYAAGLAVGALDETDIARLEGNPTPRTPRTPPMPAIAAHSDAGPQFNSPTGPTPTGGPLFSVDPASRTITGLAVPFGPIAYSGGQAFTFAPGTLTWADPRRVKLFIEHDSAAAIGFATDLTERPANDAGPAGLYATFHVANTAAGDEALQLAADGVLDGLSIGLGRGGKFANRSGVLHAISAPLREISLTPVPSFDDARVITATMSGDPMPTEIVAETSEAPTVETTPPDFAQLITTAVANGFTARQHVSAGAETTIREELPYRFDGGRGAHSFVADLRAQASGDPAARQRIETFMDVAFAVTSGNVATLNPTQNHPELYVPNLTYTTPLWDLVTTGTITDQTPFTIPKFGTAAGLVGNHTQGTEPTPGSFTATNMTVTPAPVSGKIEINREVWDAEGNPQADGIIWTEMLNGYYEAREAKIAAALNAIAVANTQGGAELNLASAVDAALVNALTAYLAGLQFVRGGNRFTAFACDGTLFPALIGAKDTAGRPLLPVLGPVNANGQTGGGFDRVAIGNLEARAAWALSSGNAANSYNFVPSSVRAWASPPRRFTFEYQVKSVDMAVWGYMATAVTRESDVKRIDYTTADV